MELIQEKLVLDPHPRGCHLITDDVCRPLPIQEFESGMLFLQIQHTSASLTINENADPDVRLDLETALNRIVPENQPFRHTCEGPDDMPAHVKGSMMGFGLNLAIADGILVLGTWQGIYLCEHRDHGGRRKLFATIMGNRFSS